jgi:hypothetical protein
MAAAAAAAAAGPAAHTRPQLLPDSLFDAPPVPSYYGSYAACGEAVYTFGGMCPADRLPCRLHRYDTAQRLWTALPSCEQFEELKDVSGTLLLPEPSGESLFVIGGLLSREDNAEPGLALRLRFDCASYAWEVPNIRGDVPTAPQPDQCEQWTSWAVAGAAAFIIGSNTRSGHVHTFDFSTRTFEQKTTRGMQPKLQDICSLAATADGSCVYALLRNERGLNAAYHVLALDTSTLTWAAASATFMPQVPGSGSRVSLSHLLVTPDARVMMMNAQCAHAFVLDARTGELAYTPGPSSLDAPDKDYAFATAHGSSLFLFNALTCSSGAPSVPVMEVALPALKAGHKAPLAPLARDFGALLCGAADDSLSDVSYAVDGHEVRAHRCVHALHRVHVGLLAVRCLPLSALTMHVHVTVFVCHRWLAAARFCARAAITSAACSPAAAARPAAAWRPSRCRASAATRSRSCCSSFTRVRFSLRSLCSAGCRPRACANVARLMCGAARRGQPDGRQCAERAGSRRLLPAARNEQLRRRLPHAAPLPGAMRDLPACLLVCTHDVAAWHALPARARYV